MATAKKTAAPKKPATKRVSVSEASKKLREARKQGTALSNKHSTVGLAKIKSEVVANQIAAGKRVFIEDDLLELPEDATPLDVMLMAMRRAYLLEGSIGAAPYAEKAAPYIHGKISTIELKNAQAPAGSDNPGGPVPFQVVFVDPPKKD